MEIQNRLDEDYLFYLGFINSFYHRLTDRTESEKCQAWLQKLCGDKYDGIDQKRKRNIYLSNLILCMQDGALVGPFLDSPNNVDIGNAFEVFGPPSPDIVEPSWLGEVGDGEGEEERGTRDGRTYLATRTLPDGKGAFAYLAVTLADEEPRWIGGGEGALDAQLAEKYREFVPEPNEMERILARRKNPEERQRVITFYDALLQNISDELDGIIPANENEIINGMLQQLTSDLDRKGEYAQYAQLSEKDRRNELLILLHDRIHVRRNKVLKREEILDNIEQKTMPQSMLETSALPQDKFELPTAMWEKVINKNPNKKCMDLLENKYPMSLIDKFLELLSNEKEGIALRMQKRHENMATAMRKELRVEADKGRKWYEEAKIGFERADRVLKALRAAVALQAEALAKQLNRKVGGVTEKTKLYEQMRATLFDTQKSVEEEAERGRILTAEINTVNAKTEMYQQVNDESISKIEDSNMGIMKNIQRLRAAIKQNETALTQIKAIAESAAVSKNQQKGQFFVF